MIAEEYKRKVELNKLSVIVLPPPSPEVYKICVIISLMLNHIKL